MSDKDKLTLIMVVGVAALVIASIVNLWKP
jgi:hypothetical protein